MVKCSIPSKTKLAENYFVLLMNYKCQTRIMCLIYGLFLVLWLLLANTKVQWEFRTCTIDYLTNNRLITESSLALQLQLFDCLFVSLYFSWNLPRSSRDNVAIFSFPLGFEINWKRTRKSHGIHQLTLMLLLLCSVVIGKHLKIIFFDIEAIGRESGDGGGELVTAAI